MRIFFPYVFFAALIHGVCIALLLCSPEKKNRPKLKPFKEKLVFLHESPADQPEVSPKTHQVRKIPATPLSRSDKQPEIPTTSKAIPHQPQEKPIDKPQPKEAPKTTKHIPTQTTKLKTISDLTKKLSDHLEVSTSHLTLALPKQQEIPSSESTLAETQEEHSQLLRQYIVLPISKVIRLKHILTPQGKVYECTILSPISEAEKQFILTHIREIPFTKFLDKYKISKNITFHIKLLSNES